MFPENTNLKSVFFKNTVKQRKLRHLHNRAEQSAALYGKQSAEVVHKRRVHTEHHQAVLFGNAVHNQIDHSVAGSADHVEHLLCFFIGRPLVAEDIRLCKAGANDTDITLAAQFFTHGFR